MKNYKEGKFIFTELENNIWEQLKTFETNPFIVNKETSSFIRSTLHLDILTNEEVRGVRNEVVKKYKEKFVNEELLSRLDRMSMIVAVIDEEIYKRGLMY